MNFIQRKSSARTITLYVLLAIGVALLANQTPAVAFALYLLGRGGGCDLAHSVSVIEAEQAQEELVSHFRSTNRILEESGGLQHWRTTRGDYWVPKGSYSGFIVDLAEQERQIYGSGQFGVQPGDVVLDAGANVGTFTREALDRGARLVVAIEPVPDNIECLRRNFATQVSAGRVIVYPKGVWDQDDVLPMSIHADSTMDSFVGVNRRSAFVRRAELPLTTVDRLVSELGLDRVDFIKLDVEGAEKRALLGARVSLEKYHPRLAVAAEHLMEDQQGIPARVKSLQPNYIAECGACAPLDNAQLGTEVFYFRPASAPAGR